MTAREHFVAVDLVLVRYESKFLDHPWEEEKFTSFEVLCSSEGYTVRKVYMTEDGTEIYVEGHEENHG
jgi:alpha-D-ribose 1-methylphosphonate 5-phosphate C-P lyase